MPGRDFAPLLSSLAESAVWIDEVLAGFLKDYGAATLLPAAASHCLQGGGKRVRPFLVRSACEACGGGPSRAVHAAAAVEMVHTYSLVHDDLPALDDDSTRRGRPTLHVMHGSPQAILAGDFLLSGAFTMLLRSSLPPAATGLMIRRLAHAAGPSFLVGGQHMDMNPPSRPDAAWARRMIDGKTAAMIRVSLELGALAGSARPVLPEGLSGLGDRLGLLFQLTDDLLDVRGTPEEMGKAVGKDEARGKANLVTLLGVPGASELAGALAEEIDRGFSALPGDWSGVRLLAEYLPTRRN